jgi:hypothetical protein
MHWKTCTIACNKRIAYPLLDLSSKEPSLLFLAVGRSDSLLVCVLYTSRQLDEYKIGGKLLFAIAGIRRKYLSIQLRLQSDFQHQTLQEPHPSPVL